MKINLIQQNTNNNSGRQKVKFGANSAKPSLFMRPVISITKMAGNNPALAEAIIGTVFASMLRPVTIMAVPGAKKEDKEYAAGKSFISGCLYLATSVLLYTPIAFGISKLVHGGVGKLKLPFKEGSTQADAFKFLTKYGMSFPIGALDAFVLFKLIPPVVNKFFKKPQHNNETKEVK